MLLRNHHNKEKEASTRKHEAFAREYMIDFDLIRAYKKTVALDADQMQDIVAYKAASRLLRSVVVQQIIDEIECEYISRKKLEKEKVILQLQRVYTNAMRDKDYTAANSALDKLMKHFGMYDKHNKQKRYNAEELANIKRKLEENGVCFDEPNKPKVIESSIGQLEQIQDAEAVVKQE